VHARPHFALSSKETLGLVAGITSKTMVLASTAATLAIPAAAHSRGNYVPTTREEHSYWPVYLTIFITVFVAIYAEKLITKFENVMQNKATDILIPKEKFCRVPLTKRHRKKEEEKETLPVELMDLEDEIFTWMKEIAIAFYQRTKAQHQDMTEKVIKEKDQKIMELERAEAIMNTPICWRHIVTFRYNSARR
jgi:hypothetical protein